LIQADIARSLQKKDGSKTRSFSLDCHGFSKRFNIESSWLGISNHPPFFEHRGIHAQVLGVKQFLLAEISLGLIFTHALA